MTTIELEATQDDQNDQEVTTEDLGLGVLASPTRVQL